MKVDILYHSYRPALGNIAAWLSDNQLDYRTTSFVKKEKPTPIDEIDCLIILGGFFHVNDTDKEPWLKDELDYIKDAIDKEKTVIGICLGAQLIALALGYKVEKNNSPEFGWFDIELTKAGIDSSVLHGIPKKFTGLHLHSDIIILPEDKPSLAKSEATYSQMFAEKTAVGIQFHAEQTEETLNKMFSKMGNSLEKGKYQQTEIEMRDGYKYLETNKKIINAILSNCIIKYKNIN